MLNRIIWLVFFTLSPLAQAHEPRDGDVHATLGAFHYFTPQLHHDFEGPLAVSPGLVAEADVSDHGGLEISMFYMNSVYSIERQNSVITERTKRMYISTGYRHWFHPKLGMALAFFSAYSMGDANVLEDDFPAGLAPKTSARDIVEYGFDISLAYEPWRQERFGLVIDGRYGYNVTKKEQEDSDHFGILIALKYFVQARQKSPDMD